MEQVKHTPAPWRVTDSGVRDRGGYICFTPSATHYPDQDERFEREKAERLANKNLIAAAPDLLEALISLADDVSERFDLDSPSTNPGIKQCVKEARAAIDRATRQGG